MNTLADGTALITIVPNSAFFTDVFAPNQAALPFVSVAAGNTTFPFSTTPSYTASPFYSQAPNTINFAVDSLMIDFVET